jgi:hypothetical protein
MRIGNRKRTGRIKAVRSANKERQNPKKRKKKKMHGARDFCPVFASFVRA